MAEPINKELTPEEIAALREANIKAMATGIQSITQADRTLHYVTPKERLIIDAALKDKEVEASGETRGRTVLAAYNPG
jgi:hypothetical protein